MSTAPQRFLAYLAGGVAALSMTTLLYSLTGDLREGYDFHAADLFLPVLLLAGFQLKLLQRPHHIILILSGILILSTLWSIKPGVTAYSSIKLALILITFSSIRQVLVTYRRQFFTPIIVLGLTSILAAIGLQLFLNDNAQAWGFSGNPNMTGGHAVVLLLNTSIWLAPFWAILLATTGSRSAVLGLAVVLPLVLWTLGVRQVFVRYALVGTAIVVLTFTFSTYYRLLPFEMNLPQVADTPIGEALQEEGRIRMAVDAIDRILERPWLGSGYDTTTQWEATNPHNIYLQFLQELGLPLGLFLILLLLRHPMSPTLISILVISFFDHYWLTTGQGMYLLAAFLAIAQVNSVRFKWRAPSWKLVALRKALSHDPR